MSAFGGDSVFCHMFFLNVSKRSVSFSFISRFITMTLGRYGIRLTSGLKGTGLSFTELIRRNKK